MTPLLRPLLASLSLACFVAPVSRADDTLSLNQLREENAALRAKLETSKSGAAGTPVVISRKTPPDLVGLDIFGSVACDLEFPPVNVSPDQLKSLKDWRMNLLGEWNAKARASIARGVSAADVARWKISLHWTQVVAGKDLISIVCHVSEETDGSSPSSTIHTFNFIDGVARPVSTAVLLSGDAALPALRTLLEKHKGDATLDVSGSDNLFRLASLAKTSGGTLTLTASGTKEGGFTIVGTKEGGFTLGASIPIDDKAVVGTKNRGENLVLEVTPEISKAGVLTLSSRPAVSPGDSNPKSGGIISSGYIISSANLARATMPAGESSTAGGKVIPGAASESTAGMVVSSGTLTLVPATVQDAAAISAQAISELGSANLRKVVVGRDTVYFCFDPGVVAPASRGVVLIPVPASELKPLLAPEGRALLEKN